MASNPDPIFVDAALLQQAERLCKTRAEQNPEDRAALRSLGEVRRKLGNLTEAAATYERLSRLGPADREAGYLAALLGGREWPETPPGRRPAPFVLLKDFLPAGFHDSLLPFVMSVRERLVPSAVISPKGAYQYDPNYRETLDFTESWDGRKRFREALRQILRGAMPRLHVAAFEPHVIEVHLRTYQDGHFFKVHRDVDPTHPDVASRVISYVYFFHRVPRRYTGGELLLFDTDPGANKFTRSAFTTLVPEDNTLVLFPSDFYHCVVPVRSPGKEFADGRFVINGFVQRQAEDAVSAGARSENSAASGEEAESPTR
jgi:hypothetical protein